MSHNGVNLPELEASRPAMAAGFRGTDTEGPPFLPEPVGSVEAFRRQRAIQAHRTSGSAASPAGGSGKVPARLGRRIEQSDGFGPAAAGGFGRGDAHAETRPDSFGCATAIAEGPGNSRSVVAERASGSASAWSAYTGAAEAFVGADATGSASATAKGIGRAAARAASGAAGNVTVRASGPGSVQAATLARGDAIVESSGRGDLEVEQSGDGLLEITFDGPRAARIANRSRGPVRLRLDAHGPLVVESGRGVRELAMPPDRQEIRISEQGEIEYLERPEHEGSGNGVSESHDSEFSSVPMEAVRVEPPSRGGN